MINFSNNTIIGIHIQSRLGAFGFLSYSSVSDGANAGLKYCVFALRCVQQNIHVFGGDLTRVTFGGESAGGGIILICLRHKVFKVEDHYLHMRLWLNRVCQSKAVVMEASGRVNGMNMRIAGDIDCLRNASVTKLRILNHEVSHRFSGKVNQVTVTDMDRFLITQMHFAK